MMQCEPETKRDYYKVWCPFRLIDGLKLYRASAYQHEPHIRLG